MYKQIMVRSIIILALIINTGTLCNRMPKVEFTERDFELTLKHDGYTRKFIVHLPKDHKIMHKMPLLVAMHGGAGTARGMIGLTKGRFNELADEHGFIVVYPQGLEKSWNDGRDDPISYAHENNIDDIGFLSRVIQRVIQDYDADPEQVLVTGISNGGFMSIRVSRELPDKVKAVAPVCAQIPVVTKEHHINAPPINILVINGTDDPLVPFRGGEVTVLGRKRGKIISTDETVGVFNVRNRCSDIPDVVELKDIDEHDGTRVIREEYKNDETGHKVVLLKIVGGGHTWPGGWQYLNEKWVGKTSMDINACDEIWSFFKSLK